MNPWQERNFEKYGFRFAWPFWYGFHHVATVPLFVAETIFGYFQGKYWWVILYESK